MPTEIDSLSISIEAEAQKANSSIDKLVARLDALSNSLGKLNAGSANIASFANGVNSLGKAVQSINTKNLTKLTTNLANLSAQGSKVGSASRSIEKGLNSASNSATRAKKSFGGLASAIGKFYASYFLFIRAVKGLENSIESTADYIEAFNYFNVALGKIGSDWSYQFEQYGYENAEAYANSFSERLTQSLSGLSGVKIEMSADGSGLLTESGMKNLGLNIQEVTQYASQLASVTNSVGQTGEVSLAAASAFTKLGADMSSLFNQDYSSVMKNLQSGLIGQSRSLYKFGIDITAATLQTYAYELGIEKAVSEMTQMEKMQLRMIAILDQSKVSWKDLANTLESPSNMIRQFKNNLKETGMILGQLFIPLLQKVLPVINGITIAIKRLLVNVANLFGVKIELDKFGQGYTDLEDDLGGTADGFDEATASAQKFKKQIAGFDELEIISSGADMSGASGSVGNYIDLTEEILTATKEYESKWSEALSTIETSSSEFAEKFETFFQPLEDFIESLLSGDYEGAGEMFTGILTSIPSKLTEALQDVDWLEVGTSIGEFIGGIDWTQVTFTLGKLAVTILDAIGDAIIGLAVENPLGAAIGAVVAVATGNAWVIPVALAGTIVSLVIDDIDTSGIDASLKSAKEAAEELKATTEEVENYINGRNNFDDLVDKYFELANKENLTEEEKLLLRDYAQTILNYLGPDSEVAKYIDAHTGQYYGTEKAIRAMIEATKEYINLKAGEALIVDTKKGMLALEQSIGAAEKEIRQFARENNLDINLAIDSKYLTKTLKEIGGVENLAKYGTLADKISELKELETNYEKAKETYEDLWATVYASEELSRKISNEISNIKSGAYNLTEEQAADAIHTLEQLRANVVTFDDEATETLNGALDAFTRNVTTNAETAADAFSLIANSMLNEINGVKAEAEDAPHSVLSAVELTTGISSNSMKKVAEQHSRTLNTMQDNEKKYVRITGDLWEEKTEGMIKSILNGEKQVSESAASLGKKFVNNLAGTIKGQTGLLNSALKELLEGASTVTLKGRLNLGLALDDTPVAAYASGGFPEDGLFYANHGELVGKFSNGRTAVANNGMITDGIRQAAYEGMMQAIRDSGGFSGNVNVSVEADANGMFRVVQRKANEYFRTTGNAAFQF